MSDLSTEGKPMTTHHPIDSTRPRAVPRLLAASLAALLVVDLVGGLWAGLAGVNTWGDAWGSHALLAAPLPMIVGQVVLTVAAVRGRSRRAAVPAGLLAAACLVSLASGFFDGGLGHVGLEPGMAAYQAFLLAVTGVVGVLAAARTAQLSARPRAVPSTHVTTTPAHPTEENVS
jgi:hypothetical protein